MVILVKSPKLGFDVCTSVKPVKDEVEELYRVFGEYKKLHNITSKHQYKYNTNTIKISLQIKFARR